MIRLSFDPGAVSSLEAALDELNRAEPKMMNSLHHIDFARIQSELRELVSDMKKELKKQ